MSGYTREPTPLRIKQVETPPSETEGQSPATNRADKGGEFSFQFPHIVHEMESICRFIRQMEVSVKTDRKTSADTKAVLAREREKFQIEITETYQRIEDLIAELGRTKLEVQALQTREKDFVSQIKFQAAELKALKQELQETKNLLAAEQKKRMEEGARAKNSLEDERKKTEELRARYSKEHAGWKEKLTQVTQDVEKLKSQIQIQSERESKFKAHIDSDQKKLQAIQTDHEKSQLHIHDLQLKLNQVKSESIAELKNIKTQFEDQIKKLQMEDNLTLNKLKSENDLQIGQAKSDLAILKERDLKFRHDYKMLFDKMQGLVDELTDLKLRNHLLTQELTYLKEEEGETSSTATQSIQPPPSPLNRKTSTPAEMDDIVSLLTQQKELISELFRDSENNE